MNKKILVSSIIVVIIIFISTYYYYKNKYTIFKVHDCKSTLTHDFELSNYNSGNSWSIQFWIYIDDLTYNYLKKKYILEWHNCSIYLSETNNNLIIELPVYLHGTKKIVYENINIQKWINVCVVLDNRHVDLWINNKLEISEYLDNISYQKKSKAIITKENNSFRGKLSKLKFYNFKLPRNHLFKASITDNFHDKYINKT